MSAYSDNEMRRYLESHLTVDHGFSLMFLVTKSLAWLTERHMTEHGL